MGEHGKVENEKERNRPRRPQGVISRIGEDSYLCPVAIDLGGETVSLQGVPEARAREQGSTGLAHAKLKISLIDQWEPCLLSWLC